MLRNVSTRQREANCQRRPRVEALEGRALLAALTFQVTNTNDTGEGSLRAAIVDANENDGKDTIRFSRGTRGEITLSSELTITDDLLIRGPGAQRLAISGDGLTRVFRIDADPTQRFGPTADSIDVEIRDLTIKDGLATDAPGFPPTAGPGLPLFPDFAFGGGLYNRGNDVSLVGIRMEENQAGSDAIPIRGSGEGATYDQLTGEYGGPAGNSNLGPIVVSGVVETVVPTFGEPNPSAPGEVFFEADFGGSQTIADLNGDELTGSISGVVVFKLGDAGTPEQGLPVGRWDAIFTVDPNNSTGRFAGATGELDVVAFNPPGFDPNGATLPFDWTIDGELDKPTGLAAGGAIANEFGGTLKVTRSSFTDSLAIGEYFAVGGAITQDLGPTVDGAGTSGPTAEISQTTFRGNAAVAKVSDPDSAGPNAAFAPFAGLAAGGAIGNIAGSLTLTHATFIGNEAHGGDGDVSDAPVLSQGDGGAAIGGAIAVSDFAAFDTVGLPGRDAVIDISFTKFIENGAYGGDAIGTATGGASAGGAIGFAITFDESLGFSADAGAVRHSSFNQNVAAGGTGGADGGNGGAASGGGIALRTGAALEVGHSRFRANTARGGDGLAGGTGGTGLGGGIAVDVLTTVVPLPIPVESFVSALDVNFSLFQRNRAVGGDGGVGGNGQGGAIGVAGPIDSVFGQSSAHVSRSLIAFNQAVGGEGTDENGGDGLGGGIFNGEDSTTTLRRDLIFANLALGGSGGTGEGDDVFSVNDLDLNALGPFFIRGRLW